MDTIHTTKECQQKVLAALRAPKELHERLDEVQEALAAPARWVLEQLMPLMKEAEECAEQLWSSEFNQQWQTKKKEKEHLCGLQGFDPMQGDTCPSCEEEANQKNK